MAIKTHKVTLSLDNPRVIQSGINVQSFDKQSIQISIELTKNDEVFQVPSDATIRVSLLKLARQEQRIIVDVPNTNRDSIDWVVPDYLDGYQGTVRVGVYLVSGAENVDLGYFTILSNVSDIDKMADEFTDNVFQGWEQIEADLNELNLTIAQTKLDLADDLTQIDNTIANINAKNTQVNTLASDFEADVTTKQTDVTSKYNAFDTSVTTANQTIDDILALKPQFQSVLDETTGKDVISAPEIILARGGAQTLGERLGADKAEVTAQLAEKALKTEVGTLASLLTTAKTSLVVAINELFNNKADKLTTYTKTEVDNTKVHITRARNKLQNGVKNTIDKNKIICNVSRRTLIKPIEAYDFGVRANGLMAYVRYDISSFPNAKIWDVPISVAEGMMTIEDYKETGSSGAILDALPTGYYFATASTTLIIYFPVGEYTSLLDWQTNHKGLYCNYQLNTPETVENISENVVEMYRLAEENEKMKNAIIALGGTII